MRKALTFLSLLLLLSSLNEISAQVVVFNTRIDSSIGSLSFTAGDFVQYDLSTNEASIYFPSGNFTQVGTNDINPDALSVRDDGSFVLSSRQNLGLAGTTFNQRQLVSYDLIAAEAAILFGGSSGFDIAGADILDNGNYLLAGKQDTSFGGQDYEIGDVVEFDLSTGTVVGTFFSHENFIRPDEPGALSAPANIDAVDFYDGKLLFSTTNEADIRTPSGGRFRVDQESVYAFDLLTGETSLFFDGGSIFNGNTDVKSFSVLSTSTGATAIPEPSSSMLAVFGLLLLCRRSR